MGVLRRHRLLVMSGFVVALALALLSYVRVSGDGLTYRNPEIWSSEATLQLSDPSHPEWRSKLPPTADPTRFTSLVDQYAEFATSDAVIRALRKQGFLSPEAVKSGVAGLTATSVASPINGSITPMLKIAGIGTSPIEATRLTLRATDTFIAVAKARQVQAQIPPSQRVELRIVKRDDAPKLIGPRSKTTFIIILLAGLTMTVAAAFLRDNLQRANRGSDNLRRAAIRGRQPEPISVLDPFANEAETAASAGSDLDSADAGPEARSITRSRRAARSSG
jgi:hypothetical protein